MARLFRSWRFRAAVAAKLCSIAVLAVPGPARAEGASAAKRAEAAASAERRVLGFLEDGRVREAQALVKASGARGIELTRLTGLLYHSVGDAERAQKFLAEAWAADRSDAHIGLRLAEVLLWRGDAFSARDLVQAFPDWKLAALDHSWRPLILKARLLSWLGDLARAEQVLSLVGDLPDLPQSAHRRYLVTLAELVSWRGDFEGALRLVDAVLSSSSSDVEAVLVKGRVLEWQGRYRAARDAYARALDTAPDNGSLQVRLEALAWLP